MYRTPMDSTKRPSFHLPIVRAAAAAGGDGDDPIDTNNESMNDPFATSTETATTTSRRKKRVRRKDDETSTNIGKDAVTSPSLSSSQTPKQKVSNDPPGLSLQPRQESRVAMKVLDVRALTQTETADSVSLPFRSVDTTAKATATTTKSSASNEPDGDYDSMDPIQRMLIDAKRMQTMEDNKNDSAGNSNINSQDTTTTDIGNTIRNVISTIVTVDFFVVCVFLLWFIAGVFSSYILKVRIYMMALSYNQREYCKNGSFWCSIESQRIVPIFACFHSTYCNSIASFGVVEFSFHIFCRLPM